MINTVLIIPCGGSGKRFGGEIPKQYVELDKVPILFRSLQAFSATKMISSCIIAADEAWHSFILDNVKKYKLTFDVNCVTGGEQRQDSVMNALFSDYCSGADKVLIHDAVRPFVSSELIKNLINMLNIWSAVIPVIPVKDTIKVLDENGFVSSTPDRSRLAAVQTPEAFRYACLCDAFKANIQRQKMVTDDASLVELMGEKVKTIVGEAANFKITDRNDFLNAENYLRISKQSDEL